MAGGGSAKGRFSLCCVTFPSEDGRLSLEIVFRDWGRTGMRGTLREYPDGYPGPCREIERGEALSWNPSWNAWVERCLESVTEGSGLRFEKEGRPLLNRWVGDGLVLLDAGTGRPELAIQVGGCYGGETPFRPTEMFARGLDLSSPAAGAAGATNLRDWEDALSWLEGLGVRPAASPPPPSP